MHTIPGTFKRSFEGFDTFVPGNLPPRLNLERELGRKVESVVHLLGRVEASRDLLPNADLLVYGSLQREALASSTIEGTIASVDELVLFQVSRSSSREAVREVSNYGEALEWGYQEIKSRPLTTNLILGLHARLMEGVRGAQSAGRFKELQNAIGSRPGQPIEEATFVPPAPREVPELMNNLERYINTENAESKVVQCALAHYQFETIHPFPDGNGRVGRLMIVLHLISLGLLSAPLIYPSVYFEKTRDEYYAALQSVRERGDWNAWIEYFSRGIEQQCRETITLTRTILGLRESLKGEVAHVRRRHSVEAVLDAFFEAPVLTVKEISDRANISLGAVRAALEDLQGMDTAREITGKQKGRVYACEPLLKAIFGEDR
jgi:Fic family protein